MRVLDNTKLWIAKSNSEEFAQGEFKLVFETPKPYYLNTRVLSRAEVINSYGEYRNTVLQIIDYQGTDIRDNYGIWLNKPTLETNQKPEYLVDTNLVPLNGLIKKGAIISASKA